MMFAFEESFLTTFSFFLTSCYCDTVGVVFVDGTCSTTHCTLETSLTYFTAALLKSLCGLELVTVGVTMEDV